MGSTISILVGRGLRNKSSGPVPHERRVGKGETYGVATTDACPGRYATRSIISAARVSYDARIMRHLSTVAQPCSTVQIGSLRVRAELTKAFSASGMFFVSGPPIT